MGTCYAIPTKGRELQVLDLGTIERSVEKFLKVAKRDPRITYELTPIGCGLAGHSPSALLDILRRKGLPKNVLPSSSWLEHIEGTH